MLPGIGNFRCQKIGRHPVAVGFRSVHRFLIWGPISFRDVGRNGGPQKSAMGRMTNALPVKTAPETAERLRPLYIPRAEAITVQRAIDLFRHDYNVSEDTLRRQVIKHRLHNQRMPGAPSRISAPGLVMALAGDDDAVEAGRSRAPGPNSVFQAARHPATLTSIKSYGRGDCLK